jgi:hypothetical protein
LGRVVVVIDRAGGAIVIVNPLVAVCAGAALSVTLTVKKYWFAVVGVPPSTPAVVRLRPGGSDEPD